MTSRMSSVALWMESGGMNPALSDCNAVVSLWRAACPVPTTYHPHAKESPWTWCTVVGPAVARFGHNPKFSTITLQLKIAKQ